MLGFDWTPEEERDMRRAIREANAWMERRYPRQPKSKPATRVHTTPLESWVGYFEARRRLHRMPSYKFCAAYGIRVKKERKYWGETYLFNEQDIERYETLHNDI